MLGAFLRTSTANCSFEAIISESGLNGFVLGIVSSKFDEMSKSSKGSRGTLACKPFMGFQSESTGSIISVIIVGEKSGFWIEIGRAGGASICQVPIGQFIASEDECLPGYSQTMSRWRQREQDGTARSQRRLAATQAAQDLRRGGAVEARAISANPCIGECEFAGTDQKGVVGSVENPSVAVGPRKALQRNSATVGLTHQSECIW